MIFSTKLKTLTLVLIAGFTTSLSLTTAVAQRYSQNDNYQNQTYAQDAEYVLVYEDCYFRGKSRALSVGEYQDVRKLNIRNDSISSLKVPAGAQVILYEDERLRGKSKVFTSDVSCLDRGWNDQASSIEVVSNRGYRTNSTRNNGRQYDNRRGSNAENYSNNYPNSYSNSPPNNSPNNDGRDYTKDVNYVAFVGTALEKKYGQRWEIVNSNGSVDSFRETNRDSQNIYLVNNRIDQKVEIDLASNQVRFVAPNGRQVNYAITSVDNKQLDRNDRARNSASQPSGIIKGGCFDYKVYTDGELAGIRFSHDHEAFFQYDSRPHRGRVCHQGELTMEINKKSLNTNVTVEINGEKYLFAKGEKEDTLLNTWYRKFIKLNVRP